MPNTNSRPAGLRLWASWCRWAVAGLVVSMLALPAWNLVLDPYQIYGMPWPNDSAKLNERHGKVGHLLANPERYDALLVGTSVMGAFDSGAVERHLPGRRFYNLSFFGGKPGEILSSLKALDAKGVRLKTILYGVEPLAFHNAYSDSPANWPHPMVSGMSRLEFMAKYLFAASFADGLDRVAGQFDSPPFIRFDIGSTGCYHLDRYEWLISRDHEKFIAGQFNKAGEGVAPAWLDSRFGEFGEILSWARSHGIDVRVFLTPMHPATAAIYGSAALSGFRDRLMAAGRLAAIPDCSRLLDGDANHLFYDAKHFRPVAAERVLACVFGWTNFISDPMTHFSLSSNGFLSFAGGSHA